jgi:arabinose-5-phosphate isomerase
MRLVGIFTDGDLRRAIQKSGAIALQQPLAQLMTQSPCVISEHPLVSDAMQLMEKDPSRPISALPVIENERLIGLIRLHDIVQWGFR